MKNSNMVFWLYFLFVSKEKGIFFLFSDFLYMTFHCNVVNENFDDKFVDVLLFHHYSFNLYLYLRDHLGATIIYNDIESIAKQRKGKQNKNN